VRGSRFSALTHLNLGGSHETSLGTMLDGLVAGRTGDGALSAVLEVHLQLPTLHHSSAALLYGVGRRDHEVWFGGLRLRISSEGGCGIGNVPGCTQLPYAGTPR